MLIFQIIGIGVIATVLSVTIKQQRPEMAIYTSIAAGVLIFILLLGNLTSLVGFLEDITNKANLNNIYLSTVLKVLGIAYITEFGSQVCKDAGEGAIASKIELGGKLIIMLLALPILASFMDVILSILP